MWKFRLNGQNMPPPLITVLLIFLAAGVFFSQWLKRQTTSSEVQRKWWQKIIFILLSFGLGLLATIFLVAWAVVPLAEQNQFSWYGIVVVSLLAASSLSFCGLWICLAGQLEGAPSYFGVERYQKIVHGWLRRHPNFGGFFFGLAAMFFPVWVLAIYFYYLGGK